MTRWVLSVGVEDARTWLVARLETRSDLHQKLIHPDIYFDRLIPRFGMNIDCLARNGEMADCGHTEDGASLVHRAAERCTLAAVVAVWAAAPAAIVGD